MNDHLVDLGRLMRNRTTFSLLLVTGLMVLSGIFFVNFSEGARAQEPKEPATGEPIPVDRDENLRKESGTRKNSRPSQFPPYLTSTSEVSSERSPQACTDGIQNSGALYQICTPATWNNDLVVYAHGYVVESESLAIPGEAGLLAFTFNLQGYAFATTSYRTNGLAVLPGISDLVDLVNIFTTTQQFTPAHVYLLGFSEGGLITVLSAERHADIFSGGIAACGPVGDFLRQVSYVTDFRLVFDYFFPGLMPGDPLDIPQSLMDDWDHHYQTTIEPVITDSANADKVSQLLRVVDAPYDLANANNTIREVLWYNVFTTNDAMTKLGGSPFDNQNKVYRGSNDDDSLNAALPRYTAAAAALTSVAQHETSGKLAVPLVTLHTTLDPIVPYWHELGYRGKVILNDNIAQHDNTGIDRYGHCNFQTTEIQGAFNLLVDRVNNPLNYAPVTKVYLPTVMTQW